jgi:bifunctional NMN adenylyltransferase/nudix hydrolase
VKYVKVFIGRFQPFHNGHLKCLRAAIDTSDLVVVIVGSASNTHEPTLKNPWDHFQRKAMIRFALKPAELAKVHLTDMPDFPGNDQAWVKAVKKEVKAAAALNFGIKEKLHVTLVGCHKGADTYYLKLYRGWSTDLMPQSEAMNATDVRAAYFRNEADWSWSQNIPGSSAAFLYAWKHLAYDKDGWIFHRLSREHNLKVVEDLLKKDKVK